MHSRLPKPRSNIPSFKMGPKYHDAMRNSHYIILDCPQPRILCLFRTEPVEHLEPTSHTMAPHHLSRRAQLSVDTWVLIASFCTIVPGLIFCVVVTVIILRRKRARKARERMFKEEAERRTLIAQERVEGEVWNSENRRGHMGQGGHDPIELQGAGEVGNGRPQQLDGFPAPAMMGYDGKPVEMPAQMVTR